MGQNGRSPERTLLLVDVPQSGPSTEQTFFWEQLRRRLCSRLRVPTSRLINRRSGTEYCVLRERLWRTCWLERREETLGVKISGWHQTREHQTDACLLPLSRYHGNAHSHQEGWCKKLSVSPSSHSLPLLMGLAGEERRENCIQRSLNPPCLRFTLRH